MDISAFENKILEELKNVINSIIEQHKKLPISAKARAGAEISAFLETQFVLATEKHTYFNKSAGSPDGATKNPWDAITYFKIKEYEEKIWIDFKAVKITAEDSNPDIGTPDKIIDLISSGSFYLVYIYVYYKETKEGLEFVENSENELVKLYYLKYISSTFRRNPKNQLQINISAKPEKRSREEFLKLLFKKIEESHKRQIEISKKALESIAKGDVLKKLIEINIESENKIKSI